MFMENVMNRYLNWCKTKSGQSFWSKTCIGLNVGIFAAVYVPQTYLLEKYQDLVQLYKNKRPAPLPDEMKNLFDEVVNDLKIHEIDRTLIKPFMLYGLEPFHAGFLNTRTGAIIGIPLNFTYKTAKDVDISKILIHNALVDTSREETYPLAESLILSRDAQKYAIAREIRTFQESNGLLDCCAASACFMSSYFFSQWMRMKFNLFNKPLRLRLALYTISGLTGLALYFTQKDFFQKRIEKTVDQDLAKLGPNYIKGGCEFYEKLLQRNLAHRSLLDDYGHKHFDLDGNPVSFLRKKTIPFTQRKSFFQELSTTESA